MRGPSPSSARCPFRVAAHFLAQCSRLQNDLRELTAEKYCRGSLREGLINSSQVWSCLERRQVRPSKPIGNTAKKDGTLFFGDVADMVGLGQISKSYIGWGTSFFDYDNDGKLDLLVVNGSTFQDDKDPRHLVPMKNFLFWQKSPTEGFYEVGAVSGESLQQAHVGRGVAFADYDNDGDMDVFIVNQEGRPQLLRNDGETS
jgi:hypothetical protein